MQLYIVAGELSGDKHGALMLQELKKKAPECCIKGLGGPLMHAESHDILDWADEAAVVGVIEVLKHYRFFRKHFLQLLDAIKKDKPEAVVFLDYPGFNLRLAKKIHQECPGIKLIYFISPQVWAWNKGRLPQMAKILDLMLCIFPFEKQVFERAGLLTEFVGHPLVDDIISHKQEGLREQDLIGLFPGSRSREVERIFPTMLETIKRLHQSHPAWRFEVAPSSERWANRLKELCLEADVSENLLSIKLGNYHSLMNRANAALVTSGTATMEAALHGLPYVLVYKVNALTYRLAKYLIKIPHIGMVNILAGKGVVRELIQHDFTPEKAQQELEKLQEPAYRENLLQEMKKAVDMLGPGGAAARAAEQVLCFLQK